jgi:hypothetical protein
MSYYFRHWHAAITADDAEAEPEAQRVFGPSYDAKMKWHAARRQSQGINRATYRPWKKPMIERVK